MTRGEHERNFVLTLRIHAAGWSLMLGDANVGGPPSLRARVTADELDRAVTRLIADAVCAKDNQATVA